MAINPIGNSSRYEATEQAQTIFKKMDSNGDGSIDKSELKAAMAQKSKDAQDTVDVDAVFSQADANNDGKIDQSENESMVKKAGAKGGTPPSGGAGPSGGTAPAGGSGAAASTQDTKIYDKRDLNKDGTVTTQEEIKYTLQHPNEQYTDQAQPRKLSDATPGSLDVTA